MTELTSGGCLKMRFPVKAVKLIFYNINLCTDNYEISSNYLMVLKSDIVTMIVNSY